MARARPVEPQAPTKPATAPRIEPRWPVLLTTVAVFAILAVLPGRIRLFPIGVPCIAAIVVIAPMAGVGLTAGHRWWLRVERASTFLFFGVTAVTTYGTLSYLVRAMARRSGEISGLQLLSSSVAVWAVNILMFSLLYWQMDRGGPEARANGTGTRPDWLFPQEGVPEAVPPEWRPIFVDYLFLGFSTATAFSPTDTLPLTSRAKMLMMLESAFSLVTIVLVASRAINILGG